MKISRDQAEGIAILVFLATIVFSAWLFIEFDWKVAILAHTCGGMIGGIGMRLKDSKYPAWPFLHIPMTLALGWVMVGIVLGNVLTDKFSRY